MGVSPSSGPGPPAPPLFLPVASALFPPPRLSPVLHRQSPAPSHPYIPALSKLRVQWTMLWPCPITTLLSSSSPLAKAHASSPASQKSSIMPVAVRLWITSSALACLSTRKKSLPSSVTKRNKFPPPSNLSARKSFCNSRKTAPATPCSFRNAPSATRSTSSFFPVTRRSSAPKLFAPSSRNTKPATPPPPSTPPSSPIPPATAASSANPATLSPPSSRNPNSLPPIANSPNSPPPP